MKNHIARLTKPCSHYYYFVLLLILSVIKVTKSVRLRFIFQNIFFLKK